ncbi:hypothetical protein UFOVP328_77 [uncultured Caudovirales phage]|uniref:Uncharacterized protein n=1 Tax=uncultured Caudovirales phage TaxID=2100421 RepID=A0A6J5LXW2_9CAUD|nr:hypothetical protein UFOVP328_77 [uncultured Caudovirales phage]
MSAVIVAYCPAAGGNHLKNILSLSPMFANSADMDLTVYDRAQKTSGAVHSINGRNIQDIFIDPMHSQPDRTWLISGHFGELATARSRLHTVNKKFVIITMDTELDRQLLERRQQRLGQHCHPYWLNEEQPYLYQPEIYQTYFGTELCNIATVRLHDLWHPTLCDFSVIAKINEFLNINIDVDSAQKLQQQWWNANFNFEFSTFEQNLYNTKKQ